MSKKSFTIAAIVAAATVGDGVFALPYIFYHAGWLVGLCYLVLLAAIVVMAHSVYLATLEKVGEKQRLLGLAKKYFGAAGFWAGFFAIVVGLLLTLVAYLILGTQFIHLALPVVRERYAFLIFWALISAPIFLNDTRVVELEMAGIICTTVFVSIIFITALPHVTFASAPAINWQNIFLPFGAVLFSLAGWTSIEPAYETRKELAESPLSLESTCWWNIVCRASLCNVFGWNSRLYYFWHHYYSRHCFWSCAVAALEKRTFGDYGIGGGGDGLYADLA
jgi:amino acid permease